MEFRKYKKEKTSEIKDLFAKTFLDSEGETEGKLIGELAFELLTKTNSEDLFAYNALENDQIIASIIFTRLEFEKSKLKAFLLSPAAVLPEYQGRGIGKKLINFGHKDLKGKGMEIVFTYGDINFYSKVGYKKISEEIVKAPLKLSYPEGWLGQNLNDDEIPSISGTSHCVEALNDEKYW
ncbi:putative N-acetyltransferase YhbS [Halanaerobium saccharolyticum]|uniref:Putative N-acetyltransferase YhbS n=1 Tax=Halanaerobium saccharolyticum TaxID=43595 RepID=A0A4R6LC61_9FIRM|nr:N-acetyltransferase [Halanaerobium saccharolyticum]TDO73401.1 putative N-acetyltransferase YhbS [Halanaerobium saccharolyticum]